MNDPIYGWNEPREQDSNYEEYNKYASVALPIDRIPQDLQNRMKKVFGKHRP